MVTVVRWPPSEKESDCLCVAFWSFVGHPFEKLLHTGIFRRKCFAQYFVLPFRGIFCQCSKQRQSIFMICYGSQRNTSSNEFYCSSLKQWSDDVGQTKLATASRARERPLIMIGAKGVCLRNCLTLLHWEWTDLETFFLLHHQIWLSQFINGANWFHKECGGKYSLFNLESFSIPKHWES